MKTLTFLKVPIYEHNSQVQHICFYTVKEAILFNVKLKHKSQMRRKPTSEPKQEFEMTKERFFEIKDTPIPCLVQPHSDVKGDVVRCRFTYNGTREEITKGFTKLVLKLPQRN